MAALTEEQSLLKDQAQAWVREQAPVVKFREMRDSSVEQAFTPTIWPAMVEMGWTGILVPEQYGGSDLGYLTFGVVLEELGKQLVASPLFASALVGASAFLLGGNDAQKKKYLPAIVDGSQIVTLAVDEGPRHAPMRTALQAKKTANGFALSGAKTFVPEGMAATTFVVAARTSGAAGATAGITLFIVPANAKGLSRRRLNTFDSRGYANLEFANVEVGADAVLGTLDNGFALLDGILDRARAGLGAEMLGTAAQAFDMTLSYLKTRVQFGKVIGSFQALGHRAAMLFTSMELARSCVEGALQGDRCEGREDGRTVLTVEEQDGRLPARDVEPAHPDPRRYRDDGRVRRGLLSEACSRAGSAIRQPGVPPRPLRATPRLLSRGLRGF